MFLISRLGFEIFCATKRLELRLPLHAVTALLKLSMSPNCLFYHIVAHLRIVLPEDLYRCHVQ